MSATNDLRYPNTVWYVYKWSVAQLKEYLDDRGINRDGLKDKLVANAFGVYRLGLPEEYTAALENSFGGENDSSFP